MLPDEKIRCPATGFAKSCRAIVAKYDCPKFVKISGVNPNDGQPIDKFGCIDSFIHMLLIENSMLQRQTGAAVESFRNVSERANERTLDLMRAAQLGFRGAPDRFAIVGCERDGIS